MEQKSQHLVMSAKVSSSLPIEDKIRFIKEALLLRTSDIQGEGCISVECKDHQELLDILQSLPYDHVINGNDDRYIILPY